MDEQGNRETPSYELILSKLLLYVLKEGLRPILTTKNNVASVEWVSANRSNIDPRGCSMEELAILLMYAQPVYKEEAKPGDQHIAWQYNYGGKEQIISAEQYMMIESVYNQCAAQEAEKKRQTASSK